MASGSLSKLKKLFDPIRIGPLELPNRIVMPAITTHFDFDESGRLWENFYAERARGGAGLLIIGAFQSLSPGRRAYVGKVNLHHDGDMPRLRELTTAIHNSGGKAAAQIATYDYWAKNGVESTAEDVGPSEVTIPTGGLHPNFSRAEYLPKVRPLMVEEILMIEEAVGDAAVRAQKAGFDAIELQVVGGSLFCRFVNPFTNRRTDQYGGTLENRTRFLVDAITNIQKKIGHHLPLICRIPALDMVPWGLTLDNWKEIALIIERAGAHALSIYPGWHETREPRHQMCVPRGGFVYLAEAIKEVVRIPVMANIRINDPVLAEQILEEGKADLIAMGTPLIADPDLPRKAKENRLEDIRMCTACCNCWDDVMRGEAITCSVNASVGREGKQTIHRVKKSRKVFVIGGGPAGMEAARVAALRGHKVTLFEKSDALGGQLLYAAIPPYKEEWRTLVSYLSTQLKKLDVEVRLNDECTVRTAERHKPDAVIVATGAEPIIPEISGIKRKNVVTALEVLDEKKKVGQEVIVVGGGSTGCEAAEFLHKKGKKVTILEMLDRIGGDIGNWNRWVVIDRLSANVRMETKAKVEKITQKGVKITWAGKYPQFFEADSVVIAVGMKSTDKIAKDLQGKVASLYKIGDCAKPGKVKEAISSGFQAGLRV
jgi:2,4-dienoyl-CoA reductase (NADPH2)